ncbi:PREDICTED: putative defensin-like protein 62 [Camelina sativa]|uniref:Defensin-like protein 62 n=1 Tax=Camelina sativa TaxID=90675 RepID=A0ABM1RBT7_CAMSA|nr:PREDICTED: putative defensin-like protein 62 [Camelina sativa]
MVIQPYARCIESCAQYYGNRKCYMDCRRQHYDGGQCDYTIKGHPVPQCCCYNYSK